MTEAFTKLKKETTWKKRKGKTKAAINQIKSIQIVYFRQHGPYKISKKRGYRGTDRSTQRTNTITVVHMPVVQQTEKNKLRCESTTNPAPVLRIAASRSFSELTRN